MNEMTALHLLRDGASAAAELIALLFMAPFATATAAESTPPTTTPAAVVATAEDAAPSAAWLAARELHVTGAALDVRLLGMLADVRVVQTVRNDAVQSVDLAARLPATNDGLGRLSIARAGRSIELPAEPGDDCSVDDDDPHAGHVRMALDEVLADLLHLPPGQRATVDVGTTATLERLGAAYRFNLPATIAPLDAQALLLEQPAGPTLIVVAPARAEGVATLTLRPASGPARIIPLGHTTAGSAIVVPLADADALVQLAHGAIELEFRTDDRVLWTTLPSTVRSARDATLARAAD
ncbi:MAG TPA: hypothetical protein VLN25_09750 [Burkholderiaceae bacterium]|nr:hypothetical protein [Burkholderiaceae bacterium]